MARIFCRAERSSAGRWWWSGICGAEPIRRDCSGRECGWGRGIQLVVAVALLDGPFLRLVWVRVTSGVPGSLSQRVWLSADAGGRRAVWLYARPARIIGTGSDRGGEAVCGGGDFLCCF